MMNGTNEGAAQKVRRKILEMARDENIDSDVLILALSDVLGDVAATCDRIAGPMPIERRLETVVERARQTYGRLMGGARSIHQ